MAKMMRNMLLLAKTETTQGTDSVPTAALNSILARGIAPTPVNAEFAERDLIRPYFGNTGSVQVVSFSSIEFEVEFAGAGTAGNAPRWSPLLQACGFSQTLTAGVEAIYSPLTNNQSSVTIYVFLDGVRHVMTGCKGNVAFTLSARGIPLMRYSFTGFTSTVTDVANPSGSDFSGFVAPLAVNRINTPTLSLHGTAVKTTEFTLDMGNEINYRNYIGAEDVAFTNRNPTGNTTFEYDAIATKNWFSITNLGTLGTLNMVHGTVAGNIVELDAPRVQITNPAISDDGGIAMLSVGLGLQPDTGNDELIITVR